MNSEDTCLQFLFSLASRALELGAWQTSSPRFDNLCTATPATSPAAATHKVLREPFNCIY